MQDDNFNKYLRQMSGRAKELRKNQTPQEKRLWYDYLKNYPIKFYRQRVIDMYIADFYCVSAKLIIELDGEQHYTESGLKYDEYRTKVLQQYQIEVIRFTNREIDTQFREVCIKIHNKVRERLAALE